MKTRLLTVFLIVFFLTGCAKMTCTEYLKQPAEDIIRIEFVYNRSFEQRDVLYTFTDKELSDFIAELSKLTISKYRIVSGYLGYLSIDITYNDGSIQMIGLETCRYVSARDPNNIELDEWHHPEWDAMCELFAQYVDAEVLSTTGLYD